MLGLNYILFFVIKFKIILLFFITIFKGKRFLKKFIYLLM
jgi:hypothetical protein